MSSIEEWINWFEKNYGFLQEKYAEKFVAISENKVIASGSSYKEVHAEAKKITKEEVYINFVEGGGYLSVY